MYLEGWACQQVLGAAARPQEGKEKLYWCVLASAVPRCPIVVAVAVNHSPKVIIGISTHSSSNSLPLPCRGVARLVLQRLQEYAYVHVTACLQHSTAQGV